MSWPIFEPLMSIPPIMPIMDVQSMPAAFIFSQQSAFGAGVGAAWACATAGRAIDNAIAVRIFFMSVSVKSIENCSISRTTRRGCSQISKVTMPKLRKRGPFNASREGERFAR